MTETPAAEKAPRKRPAGLNGMLLADLKAMAQGIGIEGAGSMKKAQLVDAIKGVQAAHAASTAKKAERPAQPEQPEQPALDLPSEAPAEAPQPSRSRAKAGRSSGKSAEKTPAEQPEQRGQAPEKTDEPQRDPETEATPEGDQARRRDVQQDDDQQDNQQDGEPRTGRNRRRRGRDRNRQNQDDQGGNQQGGQPGNQGGQQGNQGNQGSQQGKQNQGGNQNHGGHQQGGQQRQGNRHEPDTTILEDDVVVPAAGILDVLDNYAFVRTGGYLPGSDDVYLSLSMVRRFGLRRGDAITGQVRHPREGERREKFNPMVRIDSVNGQDPDTARTRAEFDNLVPLHPSERLRLETGTTDVVGRVVDLTAPLGKGQRALVVAPPDAGKTMLLQSLAASLSANHPECHLMVVLVDGRPEEVTDFQRSVKGEVIASTFDRPAADHTTMAELAIERAKRLVELGHDVVVLLDGLTRLGRAYAMSTPASGRVLPSGVDAAALFPPKRFFGAARTIENGGSLTIVATATVETGSAMDESILEEFQGTANAVVRLRHDLAEQRLFPAVDPAASGTRREDLLLGESEAAAVARLRRSSSAGGTPTLAALLDKVRRSHTNAELLSRLQKSAAASARREA